MVLPLKANMSFSSSNYYDFGTDKSKTNFESLNTYNLSVQTGKITTTIGLGADTKFNTNIYGEKTSAPVFEAKAKYNINKYLNAQARFRKIGDTEQYRVTFGGSYKLNENNSIYSSAHLTAKQKSDDTWSSNCGGWLGFTHNFENCSVSAEIQQNFPFKGKPESSDTMVNIIASIPF